MVKGLQYWSLHRVCAAMNALLLLCPMDSFANPLNISIGSDIASDDSAIRMILLFTAVSLAPAALLTLSSFVRIVVVLTFIKTALGTQSSPPQQVLIGLALFITMAVMAPTLSELNEVSLQPYLNGEVELGGAVAAAEFPARKFLSKNVRESVLMAFYETSTEAFPSTLGDVPLSLLIPAFITSELQTAFELGFLVFLPFLVIDVLTASVLMAMGMVMLPPAMISLPLKLLLFVAADGWSVLVVSLYRSFG